jgi:hypothetical protein
MRVIACENNAFDARRYGVRFIEGKAQVEDETLAELLVRDLGYKDITPASVKADNK